MWWRHCQAGKLKQSNMINRLIANSSTGLDWNNWLRKLRFWSPNFTKTRARKAITGGEYQQQKLDFNLTWLQVLLDLFQKFFRVLWHSAGREKVTDHKVNLDFNLTLLKIDLISFRNLSWPWVILWPWAGQVKVSDHHFNFDFNLVNLIKTWLDLFQKTFTTCVLWPWAGQVKVTQRSYGRWKGLY